MRFRWNLFLPLLFSVVSPLAGLWGCSEDPAPAPIPTLRVPSEYPNPQAAMDAAEPGSIVLIEPGEYAHSEHRDLDPVRFPTGIRAALFVKKGVFVLGDGDRGSVVFTDTTAADSTVGVVCDSSDIETLVENLTLVNYGTGVLISGGGGVVQVLTVRSCRVGIHTLDVEDPLLLGNRVELAVEAGIRHEGGDSFFGGNDVVASPVAIEVRGPGQAWLEGNVLCGNGVGISVMGGAAPVLVLNVTTRNTIAGMQLGDGAVPVLSRVPLVAPWPGPIGNDFLENPIHLEITRYDPPLPDTLDVSKQYWGTVDFNEIDGKILDVSDDPARGATVEVRPISPDLDPAGSLFELVFGFSPFDQCDAGTSVAAIPVRESRIGYRHRP